jgi:UDPglucose--hexose-1-phosphate uridylyltransferase
VFCDIVRQELTAGVRIVQENADIIALSPYAPRFPFETWLLPRRHAARFEEAPRHEYESLARLLKAVVTRIDRALESPAYNLIIHSAPFNDANHGADLYHWHMEILPKLARTAGFEWGTGFYINPTSPEEATRVLRGVKL